MFQLHTAGCEPEGLQPAQSLTPPLCSRNQSRGEASRTLSGPQLIGTVRGAPQRLHVAPRQRRAEQSPQIQHFNPPGVHSESKQGVNEKLLLWAGPTFLYGSIAALRATEQLALLARPKRRPWPTSAGTLRSSALSRSSTEHRPLASTGSARITRRGRTEKLF